MKFDGYWVFACNPRDWAVDAFLKSGEAIEDWRIPDRFCSRVSQGQLALIWVGKDHRTKSQLSRFNSSRLERGVYAVCEIISFPHLRVKPVGRFSYDPGPAKEGELMVDFRLLRSYLERPLTSDTILKHGGNMYGPFRTGFRSSMPIPGSIFHHLLDQLPDVDGMFDDTAQESSKYLNDPVNLKKMYGMAAPEVVEQIRRLGGKL